MGLINDFKRLLFAKKAVTKSAMNKVADAGKEKGEEFADMADDLMDKAKDKAEDIGEQLKGAAESTMETAKETIDHFFGEEEEKPAPPPVDKSIKDSDFDLNFMEKKEIDTTEFVEPNPASKAEPTAKPKSEMAAKLEQVGSEVIDKSQKVAEKVGAKVLDAGEEFMEKFGETAEKVGGVVLEKSGDVVDKAKDLAEDIGSKILEAKEELAAKAAAEMGEPVENTDSLIDQVKNLADKIEDKVKGKVDLDAYSDKPHDAGEDLLADKGSFFEKAARFADGDYQMKGKEESTPGELKIGENPDFKAKPKEGTVKGFEDLDGDGNELIDDAIIDEE